MRPTTLTTAGALALCACLAAAGPAGAQGKGKKAGRQDARAAIASQPQPPAPPGGRHGMGGGRGRGPSDEVQKVIQEAYYAPEMVREHAEAIQLTDDQIDRLRKATSDVRNEVDQLEWDVARESRRLAKLLRDGATKEQVYAQMDVVFTFENKIKKKMLGMLIVVRDVLTKQQRAQLDELKAEWAKDRPGRGMGVGRGGRHGRGGPGGPPGFPPEPPGGPPPPGGFPPGPPPDAE